MHRLLLLRHGETEWSRAHKHTGRADIPLTDRGEDQARLIAGVVKGREFGVVRVSPLQRARRTAELAALTSVVEDPNLLEWDYGAYEGKLTREIEAERPGWNLWAHGAEGGESLKAVGARADAVLDRLAAPLARGDAAVVAHGHMLRVLVARYLGLPPSAGSYFRLGTGTVCEVGREHGRPVVLMWNAPPDAHPSILASPYD